MLHTLFNIEAEKLSEYVNYHEYSECRFLQTSYDYYHWKIAQQHN